MNVIQSELKAVGIQVTPDNLSNTTFLSDVDDGHFQLAYDWDSSGPGPYYELRQLLYSPNTAPIGTAAASNFERYSSKSTDALIDQYAATTNSAVQHKVVDQLEQVMLSDVPVIPVTEQVDWYQYDTQYIGGWVTSSNPYAQPAQYIWPDWGVVYCTSTTSSRRAPGRVQYRSLAPLYRSPPGPMRSRRRVGAKGMKTTKRGRPVARLSSRTSPPCASTRSFTTASPIPLPPALRPRLPRKNRSKTRSCSSWVRPGRCRPPRGGRGASRY